MNPHVDVGAYLLGALDDAEMTAFEEHLAECDACGRELDELSGVLPALQELREDGVGPVAGTPAAGRPLPGFPAAGPPPAAPPTAGSGHGAPGRHRAGAGDAGAGAVGAGAASGAGGFAGTGAGGGFAAAVADGSAFAGPPSGDGLLERLLATVANERRTRRRRRLVAMAAAAVLVVGGPAIAVVATSDDGGHGTPVASAEWKAGDRATGVFADVAISDRAWGSAVDLKLTGVYGPRICHMEAIGLDGGRQTVATWSVPPDGYGTRHHPLPLTVHGASGLHKDAIKRFDVRTSDGTLLVSIPDHSSPPSDEPRRQTGE